MRRLGWCLSLMVAALCAQEPAVVLPPDLARVLTDYEAGWRAKDNVALAKLFAEDGFVLSPGEPIIRGRKAIEQAYKGEGGPLFLRAVAFSTQGTMGYIIGGFRHRVNASDIGKFTLVLEKDETGRWMIKSDMDNGIGR